MLTFAAATSGAALASAETGALTGVLLGFARGGAEWILWILVILLLGVLVVLFERLIFLRSVDVDADQLRQKLREAVDDNDLAGLAQTLSERDSMQERVLAYGLQEQHRGPEAVEELCSGAVGIEKMRYEKRLSVLATIGSNAPFIGLFGTVLGVIMAFDQLQAAAGAASGPGTPGDGVMGAIAEALIATGVGLLVAIPAIIFFNMLKLRVQRSVNETGLLVKTAVALMRSR